MFETDHAASKLPVPRTLLPTGRRRRRRRLASASGCIGHHTYYAACRQSLRACTSVRGCSWLAAHLGIVDYRSTASHA
ncbi:uncharacterized protein CC84DRAFT_407268 [Paraphaeosphaeria sporulosa]|uniref:Uncharacterized protein n=1 Tax=Paraphaeosphaeria sporulosa TaxID=1460663 RepID=A0A177BVI6_9PLEO|nr:uncharacterized protein CC84DRAFT_407268 [Paraphaeosphaeria sporulosa]OAF99493.1 hypothetical protein CC84DRAFT_407268 [Paraphaeosphaeria sporulosa]